MTYRMFVYKLADAVCIAHSFHGDWNSIQYYRSSSRVRWLKWWANRRFEARVVTKVIQVFFNIYILHRSPLRTQKPTWGKQTHLILTLLQRLTYLLTYLLTNLLTPWSRVLLEKLTGSATSQEIPRIFGIRKFITVPATCPYPEPTPSSPHNPLPLPEDPS